MEVIITENAREGQLAIFEYHLQYSAIYAEETYFRIDNFIRDNLSEFPRLGHIYNEEKSLYRLIYEKRYNIYYVIQDDRIYVLYIVDGQLELNMLLSNPSVELPE